MKATAEVKHLTNIRNILINSQTSSIQVKYDIKGFFTIFDLKAL